MHYAFIRTRTVAICGLGLCASLLAAGCTADVPTSKASTAPVAEQAQIDASTAKPSARDGGAVARGAGMPIVPIHRADAGPKVAPDAGAAGAEAATPPLIVATPDAGREAGQDAATPERDAARAMQPEVEPELPRPIHRYSFSGTGDAAHDEHGGAAATLEATRSSMGRARSAFPGKATASSRSVPRLSMLAGFCS